MRPGVRKKRPQGAAPKYSAHPAGPSDLSRVPQASESRAACRTKLGAGRGVTEAMVRDGQGGKPGSAQRNVSLGCSNVCLGHVKPPAQLRV